MTHAHHSCCSHTTPSIIETNISLKTKNYFQTGGNALYFAQPRTQQTFAQALLFAHEQNIPITLLGHGANVLISDEGVDGLVICPALVYVYHAPGDHDKILVTAGAGLSVHDLILYCLENDLLGLEEFSGIPGTVGGSVYINLHYFEFLLEHFLVNAQVIEKATGTIKTVDPSWFNFGYNTSRLQEKTHFLLDATFAVRRGTPLEIAYAQGRRIEIIRHRAKKYPILRTCGSFFRNFYEHEVTLESQGKKIIYAAYYLDKLGIKGTLSSGDAVVSHQHANMIVNANNATSTDIINLARTMQLMAHETFGVKLQPECQFLGFKKYPLAF
ncbi:MAG TPA: UDP-N-acetylmuramate dehydrogenase [Candidatus Bathyarchaeia archaeon]|nr:UDP-N-acetylmuramate dehydrogenase [Candidatus Bathyarchaeia archaeon]